MSVKDLDCFINYKYEGIYRLTTIALPITKMPEDISFDRFDVYDTERKDFIEVFKFYDICFTEKDEYMAIYKKLDAVGPYMLYATPIENIFNNDVEFV